MRKVFNRFATIGAVSLFLIGAFAFFTWQPACFTPGPPVAFAQGSGQNTFSQKFIALISTSHQYFTIPNNNQTGHSLSYTFSSSDAGISLCGILLEGSSDKITWQILSASSNVGASQVGTFFGNGYFTYLRLEVQPCSVSNVTVDYTGYGTLVPIPTAPFPFLNENIGAVVAVASGAFSTPQLLTGFQCSNPGSSSAFLQLFSALTAPTLGAYYFYEQEIPAGGTIYYDGLPLAAYLSTRAPYVGSSTYYGFWAGASTAAAGGTAVSTPVICNFQINASGPYTPYNPTP